MNGSCYRGTQGISSQSPDVLQCRCLPGVACPSPFFPEAFTEILVTGIAEDCNDNRILTLLEARCDLQAAHYGCSGRDTHQQSFFTGELYCHFVRIFGG